MSEAADAYRVSDVVSFRPTDEELRVIETTRRRLGLSTRADAVRHLLRLGAARTRSLRDEPVFRFRLPKTQEASAPITSRSIDDVVYGP